MHEHHGIGLKFGSSGTLVPSTRKPISNKFHNDTLYLTPTTINNIQVYSYPNVYKKGDVVLLNNIPCVCIAYNAQVGTGLFRSIDRTKEK